MASKSTEPKGSIKQSQAMCIGFNKLGEFGLGNKEIVTLPTAMSNPFIRHIYPCSICHIYTDDKLENIWIAGNSNYGFSTKLESFDYFKLNSIKLVKICVSVSSPVIFAITNENKVYIWGKYQIGSEENKFVSKPTLLPQFNNVITAAATTESCVILCSTNTENMTIIINNWSRVYQIPQDIITILLSYTKSTTVYSTGNGSGSGQDQDEELENEYGWNEIEVFNDKNIIKISCGQYHTLFLEDNGTLWSSGHTGGGRLGLGDVNFNRYQPPTQIEYFMKNDIRIVDMDCCYFHNVAISEDGRVYGWGHNGWGQCGIDGLGINTPKMIKELNDYVVDKVCCGYFHSYFRTNCGKHFMCGGNSKNECMIEDEGNSIFRAKRIDLILKEKYNVTGICNVALGYRNTIFVCNR